MTSGRCSPRLQVSPAGLRVPCQTQSSMRIWTPLGPQDLEH
uniref:Uncharacterized protein n=1 Tax=Romanomermis culicivorax TaxID=13658 RepID=A0A915HRQ1_ROMCU